jgi:hypothetical protein
MNTKRLQQAVDILKERYKHEIHNEGDWWHFLQNYAVNIHDNEGEDAYVINVYPYDRDTGITDYSVQIDLEPFNKQFELAYED